MAADRWLPGRLGRTVQYGMPVLVMVGYGAGWDNYALRLAWSNGCIGLQMLALGVCLLQPVKLHQFDLAGQAHGHRQRLRIMNPNGVAQWRKEASSEELNPLGFIEMTSTRE